MGRGRWISNLLQYYIGGVGGLAVRNLQNPSALTKQQGRNPIDAIEVKIKVTQFTENFYVDDLFEESLTRQQTVGQ